MYMYTEKLYIHVLYTYIYSIYMTSAPLFLPWPELSKALSSRFTPQTFFKGQ